ncbi:MAG: hypothetical protein PHQ93_10505 [Sulfurimonas sp.]|uniref:hypothetical protein n=1 Tax=Sulfurimonas sp. TaxID=2022749 RepID=UPI00260EBACD|nr:hypothetical protein [Sulfurimonas sp.]MDD5401608.1 hypothetical protein [Sulfurimonas sp.]
MSSIKDFGNSLRNSAQVLKDDIKQSINSFTDSVTKPIKDIKYIKQKNEEIKTLVETTNARINPMREVTNKKLEELGKIKVGIISTTIDEFTFHMKKINNLPFHNTTDPFSKNTFNFSQQKLDEVYTSVLSTKKLLKKELEVTVAGTLSTGAIYTAVGALGTASTGAGIAGLIGSAMNNATLAWLGGGALAAGGGITIGTIVLGGLGIIPAVSYMAWKGKFNYQDKVEDVNKVYQEANKYANNTDQVIKKFEELSKFIDNSIAIIQRYNIECIKLNKQTDHIRHQAGNDYNRYTNNQQLLIQKHMHYFDGLLRILNTPIINEDGSINNDIVSTIKYSNDFLNTAEKIRFVSFKKRSLWIYAIPTIVIVSIAIYIYYQYY